MFDSFCFLGKKKFKQRRLFKRKNFIQIRLQKKKEKFKKKNEMMKKELVQFLFYVFSSFQKPKNLFEK